MTASKFIDLDGSKFAIQHTFDIEPNIESAAALRSNGMVGSKDNWHVARIDMRLLHKLITEAGIKWSDKEAVREHVDKLLHDGTLAKFRVHEGSYK